VQALSALSTGNFRLESQVEGHSLAVAKFLCWDNHWKLFHTRWRQWTTAINFKRGCAPATCVQGATGA